MVDASLGARISSFLMNRRGQQHERRSPIKAGWWSRLLVAAVFALYVNYVPFHLVSEPHSHDASAAQAMASHSDEHHDPDHDGHDDHHAPHPASEHSIQMLPKSESLFLCLAFLPVTTGLVIEAPEPQMAVPFIERIWSPGESPPEPSQPRAPPIA